MTINQDGGICHFHFLQSVILPCGYVDVQISTVAASSFVSYIARDSSLVTAIQLHRSWSGHPVLVCYFSM